MINCVTDRYSQTFVSCGHLRVTKRRIFSNTFLSGLANKQGYREIPVLKMRHVCWKSTLIKASSLRLFISLVVCHCTENSMGEKKWNCFIFTLGILTWEI